MGLPGVSLWSLRKTSEFLKMPGDLVIFWKNTNKTGFFIKGFSHLKKDVPVTLTGWMSFIPNILQVVATQMFLLKFSPRKFGEDDFRIFFRWVGETTNQNKMDSLGLVVFSWGWSTWGMEFVVIQ